MSGGRWVFKNGVVRLQEVEPGTPGAMAAVGTVPRMKKVVVHTPKGLMVRSYPELEQRLRKHGWERYHEDQADPALAGYHFCRRGSLDLISLPADFASFSADHMYDIVVKNREYFRVINEFTTPVIFTNEAADHPTPPTLPHHIMRLPTTPLLLLYLIILPVEGAQRKRSERTELDGSQGHLSSKEIGWAESCVNMGGK